MSAKETHTMLAKPVGLLRRAACPTAPDGTIMQGASHSEGYANIFTEKNYWIGVAVGVLGLIAYQKYIK